ncbi:MAG TPA: GDSL-type esterase/lipase family protein [Aquabacterium sp.]|uniref:SGNH/GDSL hydrolase family protein n=1 Tax=Aquabacterium sp. TaxID=1872578 RepID=UPI002E2FB357|nr:GDSL-type esterase/lipase family protein [Aquabacterium sp.]HEX5357399.1 GDSL-type esterase/lipase family protein [Aquabacterium sp.]
MRRIIKWIFIAYLVVLHLLMAIMLARYGLPLSVRIKLGLVSANTPFYESMLSYQHSVDTSLPDGTVVFLGDSITQGLANVAVAPNSVNYGIGGQSTSQLHDSLRNYPSLPRAKAIVLTIGINDFLQHGERGVAQRLAQIDQALPAHVPLIWNAVMPVAPEQADLSGVAQANAEIKRLCAQRPQCTYVDTWPLLADESGLIRPAYFMPDGIHLSPEGYRVWIAALKKHAPQ